MAHYDFHMIIPIFHNNEPMSFKFSTNFLLPYVRKPAKYWGCGSIGLDATPTVLIHIGHPVQSQRGLTNKKQSARL